MLRRSRVALAIGVLAAVVLSLAGQHPLAAAQEHPKAAQAVPKAVESPGHPGAAAPKSEHPAEEPVNPMRAEPTLAIWSLVVFLGLLAVLTKYAWKPLIHALHEREKHLEHVLHETERARNESETLLSEHRKQMARAADEVRSLLEQARQDAQTTGEKIVKAAQTEAESAKQRATRDIATARDQALADIWQKTADMAVSVAGRVLSRELTDNDHRRLLDAAISELPAAPGANGHGGKA
jgi:F-type H+-transporting ATPase subunit b